MLVALVGLWLEDLGPAVGPHPTELRPILRPAIGEDDRLRQDEDVANAAQVGRIGRRLRLLVDRAVQARAAQRVIRLPDDEADGHEPGPAVRVERGEHRSSGLRQEPALVVREDRLASHGPMMHGSPMARVRFWTAVVGVVALLAVVGGCGPAGSSPPGDDAFAALTGPYHPQPISLDRASIDILEQACTPRLPGEAGGGQSRLAMVDARGLGMARLVFMTPDRVAVSCLLRIDDDRRVVVEGFDESRLGLQRPGPDSLVPLPPQTRETAAGTWTTVEGLVGSNVVVLTFELADGTLVRTSLADGYFVGAWASDQAATRYRGFDAAGSMLFDQPAPVGA
jgi:hypothetical protein